MSFAYRNRCEFMGRLGDDPVVMELEYGLCATIDIGQTKVTRNKSTGETNERTEWNRIKIYGKTAEFVAEYLRKGCFVNVVCGLRNRSWEDNEGVRQYVSELVINERNHELMVLAWPKEETEESGKPNNKQKQKPSSKPNGRNQRKGTKPEGQRPKPTSDDTPAQTPPNSRSRGIDTTKYEAPASGWDETEDEPF